MYRFGFGIGFTAWDVLRLGGGHVLLSNILLEDGGAILLEDGGYLLLEG